MLVVASLGFIGVMTLLPARPSRTLATLCLFCGPQGGVDFVLNTVLFVPLGIGLRWFLEDWKRPVVLGGLTTLFVETLQFRFVPGRDASLGDLVANTLGTAIGAWLAIAGIRWLSASGRTARQLAAASAVLSSGIFAVSAWFLLPAETRYPQFVQWTPQRPNTVPFFGHVRAVELNGSAIRNEETLPAHRLISDRRISVRVTVRGPVPVASPRAIIAHMADRDEEGFSLSQRGDDLLFRTHTRGASFRFRPLVVEAANAFSRANSDSGEISIDAVSEPRAMVARTSHAGTETQVTLRRTVGLGWAILFPWDLALTPAFWPISAAWLAVLVVPVAFFSLRTARKAPDDSPRNMTWWPALLVLGSMLVVPMLMRLSWLSAGELAGVAAGVLAGMALEKMTAHSATKNSIPDA